MEVNFDNIRDLNAGLIRMFIVIYIIGLPTFYVDVDVRLFSYFLCILFVFKILLITGIRGARKLNFVKVHRKDKFNYCRGSITDTQLYKIEVRVEQNA